MILDVLTFAPWKFPAWRLDDRRRRIMLLPNDALIGWTVIALPTAVAVWRWRRYRVIWLGLAVAAAGFVYAFTVMANRPHNYYAILEVYAGGFAIAVGLIMIVASLLVRIGVVRLGPPDPNNR